MKKTTKLLLLLPLLLIFTKNISAQVTANFTTNNAAGCPNPFLAIVSDASTSAGGTIVSWNWQLTGPAGFTPVNSVNSQIAAPLSIPGLYNVTLTACDDLGFCDTRTINGFIEVFNRPTISYTITPTVGCPPLQVCFDGTIDPGCGTVQSTVFDLRDGNIVSNQTDFCHTYQNSGTYSNFVVSATNSCGCVTTTTINQSVSVTAAPVANFTATQTFSCTAPLTTTITSTSTVPPGSTLTWIIPGFPNATGNSVTRTFPAGSYNVTLIVAAPNGCSDTLTRNNYITVGQQNADFSSSVTNVCAGNSVSFQNLSSGTPSGFQWSFPGGTPATSTQQNPVVTYNTIGSYNVTLIVTYTGGCRDTIIRPNYISVNTPPVSSYTVSQTSSCNTPFTTTFTSTSTNSAQTRWQFTGGIPATFVGNGPVNVTYINPGTYSITMIDSAANGCVTSRVFNNVISITPLTVSIFADTINGCIPLATNFNFTLNLPETVTTASWSLPGSNLGNSNDLNPSAVYNTVGCYEASLTVNTLNGCVATVTRPNIVCAGSPPTSSFTYTPPSVCFEEDEVCFTYTGAGADTIIWNFGDGSPSQFADELATVCHPYTNEIGVYTVTMIPFQYGCAGDSLIIPDAVEILGPVSIPVDSFSCLNQNQRFFRSNSLQADSVFWIFGDPNAGGTDTSSLTNPQWNYSTTGTFTARLITYNFTTGCDHERTLTVRVFTPQANFTSNRTAICVGSNITFTNTSQFINSSFNATRWDWDLSDGITFPNNPATRGHNFTRTFNQIGVFGISMRNQDNNGCFDTIIRPNLITVHGILGGFTTTTPRVGCAPLTVSFLDTSVAPLTGIASWFWNFGDPTTTADTSTLRNPTYTYTNDGFYNVTLTVTDSFGCVRTYNYANYVNARRPNASFTLNRNFICNNQSVNITNTSTGNGLTYSWQFTNATPATSNLLNPGPITFNQEGIQTITLTVTDNQGCSHTFTRNVSVFDVVAQGSASPNFSSCFNPPQLVNFTNLSLNNVDTTSALWDFGNGLTSTNYNASTIYNVAGVYPVTLTISSLSGCTSTQIVDTVFIGGPYGNINLLSASNVGCPCTDITFEITTLNALAPTLLPGDGNAVALSPMVMPGDTVRDTITYSYCQIGQFSPLLFIQDGTCSGNINSSDTIFIDSLVIGFDFSVAGLCDNGQVCFTNQSFSQLLGVSDITSVFWDFGDGNTSTDFSPCNFYASAGSYNVELTIENSKGCFKTLVRNVYIPESPIAQFGQSSVNGCANVAVMFYDSTILDPLANIASWLWDFGGGNTSDLQNPQFTFTNTGVETVTLTVTDNFGCTSQTTSTVEVFALPNVVASNDTSICIGASVLLNVSGAIDYVWTPDYFIDDFNSNSPLVSPLVDTVYFVTGTDINGCSNVDSVRISVNSIQVNFTFNNACESDTVFFTDLSQATGGTLVLWNWNFGDGETSNNQNPFHIYTNAGIYDVNLEVTDNLGCISDTTIQITINESPVAQFVADSICIGLPTTFNSTTSSSGDGNIISWAWDFGDGTGTSDLQNPVYTYSSPGIYNVCLTITTDLTCTSNNSSVCADIVVYDLPSITINNSSIICIGDDLQLTATGGTDYLWTPDYFVSDVNVSNPLVSPQVDTTYVVTVTDLNGCVNSDSVFVQVNRVDADFTANNSCVGDTVNFSDLSTSELGNVISWSWNFGDGETSNTQNPFHIYTTSGVFDASLEVTDDLGCTSDITIQVTISEPPVAQFVADSICIGLATTFNSTTSSSGDGNIVAWAWDFGDGTGTSDLQNPVYTYSSPGIYNVCLTITTDLTCTSNNSSVCADIVVYDLPSITINNSSIICIGDDLQLTATGGTNYLWTPDYFVSDVNVSNPLVSPQVDTTYFVTVTDINGCVNSDSVFVQVNSLNAAFTADNSCAGDTTNFTDLSTSSGGVLVAWNWIFDDGNSSVLQNPENVYVNPGSYNVTLLITDDFGCTDQVTQVVNVSTQPVAQFTADSVCVGLTTTFNSSASDGGAGNIISYSWNFGVAGGNSNAANPTFTYAAPGIYNVCLTITTDALCEGNSSTVCNQVVVYALPVASFTADTACFGSANSFVNNAQSTAGTIVQSFWNFGQNPGDTLLQAGVSNATFTYVNTGNYIVSLTVTDEFGCTANTTRTAFVFENPVADFTFTSACIGQPNEFVSLSVPGVNNPVVQYLWNFDEGAGFITGDSIQFYSFQNSGPHNIVHVVVDAFGCSDTLVTPLNIIAGPQAVITASATTVCSGNSINFSAANSVVQVGPASFEWDFVYSSGVDQTNPNPVYIPNTSSTVALFVQDANGCRDTAFVDVTVVPVPVADFTFTPACEDIAIQLNSTSTQAGSPLVNYEWIVDGVSLLNGQNVQYTHPTGNDTIEVLLLVTDANGCEDGVIYNIYVEEQPILQSLLPDFTICAGDTVFVDLNDTTQFTYSGVANFEWVPSSTAISLGNDSFALVPGLTTFYNLIGSGTNNVCPPDNDNQVIVRVLNKPTVTIDATPNPIISGTSSQITVDVIPYNGATDSLIWTNGQNSLFPLLGGNVTATPTEETTYPLTLVYYIDTFKCELDTFVTISVLDICGGEIVYVPNIFTPNNDGKNDEFRISGYGLTLINKLIVFDRWGKVMFEGNNLPMVNGKMQNGWRGDNKAGKSCNSGVYVYLYEATCANGDIVKGNGNVTLIK